ncbi:hypothetical protein P170DRAFT_465939 [Aspergillus steynii IBT 23096]|uniref:DUF6594 domain-containing protein n=1 Tax=Aspergillus steynii IBT 23096 TaxID=1392250 RepID=A0A2I2G0K6_9EURO|nr:uncharacterized protein P170DRAFT_465939 [Aspergillus steynii IBT 23096]PLB46412.1 hypothetical protein P170DRAFT_465939 [Aspergillus steynii IBT 23096]
MKGYDQIAAFIAKDPGSSIYRRFANLNAKNILYFQAELIHLETELQIALDNLKQSEKGADEPPISFWHLKQDGGQQWQKILEIREVLDKYNTALIKQKQVLQLRAPDQSDWDAFNGWMIEEEVVSALNGPELKQWMYHQEDFIALHPRHGGEDHFTKWISSSLIPWFHRKWSRDGDARHDPEMGTWTYSDQKIKSFTRATSIIISAVLPASAMVALYFIKDTTVRLIVIFIYNLVFSFSLALMVKARPIEIFAAATAFAAVQVTLITNAP